MLDFEKVKTLLDEINGIVADYDPLFRATAKDILLNEAFGLRGRESSTAELPGGAMEYPTPLRLLSAPSFGALICKWSPKFQSERALLCLYYLQSIFGLTSVDGLRINRELIDHNMRATNITVSMFCNSRHRPPFVRATAKKGRFRQSRNEYSITDAGIKYVESKLNRAL